MIEILSPAPGIKLEDLWYILAQLLVINLFVLVINIINWIVKKRNKK